MMVREQEDNEAGLKKLTKYYSQQTCNKVLLTAFPSKVAEKKVMNGIPKCPQVIPARSNKGLGIEAQAKIVHHPYFLRFLKIANLALSMKVSAIEIRNGEYSQYLLLLQVVEVLHPSFQQDWQPWQQNREGVHR